ncbi:SusD/RagB family nutrient-binding outer membrane lipoprotein [Hymenobacter sp. BRD128]|uniref:SusD/RagB family nutrient-binding outer membrane lipoprotein n=1 Tax=Hymenobacter sp. BRD128 TaxID=2675878 RepID=UPI0015652745|nr:SusD/RagB family nutrient-binding outer membrane lipoprotein [Hymenobacter sp. BRD128]QKG58721.1 SusD/RagB family nutrient-binding outer membrane lipoprotein [Hymenobacter sp. BRD128]
MKVFFKVLVAAGLTAAATSCKSYLDINTNPNSPTAATPDAILAQALTATAANYTGNNPSFNSYASWAADYWAKSGIVNGYIEERTYNYTTQYYSGLFDNTYHNLNDYNLIQSTGATTGFPYHAAIARIMKVYNYQLLVDEYGDIPYSTSVQGLNNLSPTYDKAATIYKDFIVQLDGAIADIKAANKNPAATSVGAEDVVFGGNMTKWIQFANSMKLRVLLRQSQSSDASLTAYVQTQMTALQQSAAVDGFITTDVLVQPGYSQSAGKQNPFYNRYGKTPSGSNATERSYQIPTSYIISQYHDNKDPRLSQLYTIGSKIVGKDTIAAYIGTTAGETSPPLFTYPIIASRFLFGGGILKGYNAPTALMLLAEQDFSKAEAETRNLFTGGDAAAKMDYLQGIQDSFNYFYRPATSGAISTGNGLNQYKTYISTNAGNPLVDYDAATPSGSLGKQSVIIYQKYLAMNSIASTEAWDDYRRTGQPKIMASLESTSPRPDKLPARLLYPISEVSSNVANIPTGVNQFTPIFWAN